ncbi:MAG: ATP phosphoribosyltransferase [Blastocatellia bacterium]|nr:ATP phosphoribosyltransferase [Blastocatellia bacterium]
MRKTRNLRIAVQRSGRLSESSVGLLRRCDVGFDNGLGKLRSTARDFPLEIFFLRDDDIPRYIEDGVADVGIVGENILEESGSNTDIVERLGFGKCRLSIAVPRGDAYTSLADLAGKRIATSYPNILGRHLCQHNVEAEIHTISGSVEIAPGIGLTDAVCDLVSSGSTLLTNGLTEVETVMMSEAVLVRRRELDAELEAIFASLLFRIRAVGAAARNKYILLNAPNEKLAEVVKLLPGIKSPTVMPLAEAGWSSVHSVIGAADHWNIVERLKAAGAEGILVLSIDQMIG